MDSIWMWLKTLTRVVGVVFHFFSTVQQTATDLVVQLPREWDDAVGAGRKRAQRYRHTVLTARYRRERVWRGRAERKLYRSGGARRCGRPQAAAVHAAVAASAAALVAGRRIATTATRR
ncbi:efflux transporter, RND family, MFP subunit [Trichinella spiralis]|uniref:efflux transporter, RND family, MFP subunit n=1 Tax=Trichinella spiralis TaxID=6334 RepID=UPI0001EFBE09|nr:efflux transporter, RND family, MFP subunit [Trichinella spiralis]